MRTTNPNLLFSATSGGIKGLIQERLYRREVTLLLQQDIKLKGISLCEVCLICPYAPLAQEILNLLSTYLHTCILLF